MATNDLRYSVRSREIVDLFQAMRTERLTLSPYFQRNLVWREAHKRDFIDTILKGYPFPQIFLARGPINLDTMQACQCVVDGQQRLTTIKDYILGKLLVNGKTFNELAPRTREEFLKYEIAVIDFDLDVDDERLKDVFHRLNRTFYSLSAIEKLSSEYSASEFMLVARVLSGEITREVDDEEDELGDVQSDGEEEPIASNLFSRDPGVDDAMWQSLLEDADGTFANVLRSKGIFSAFEFDRKVPLMFTLNIMGTVLAGYYNRNDRVRKYLDDKASDFPERAELISALNASAAFIEVMNFPQGSMWWNKANFFTLVCELGRSEELRLANPQVTAQRLNYFASNVPPQYALEAREAVGRKGVREARGATVRGLLREALAASI